MYGLFAQPREATEDQRVVERVLLQKLFLDLPDEVRAEIDLDQDTRDWFGVATFSAVQVSGRTFDARQFVSAVESALAGNRAPIQTPDSDQQFYFALVDQESEAGSIANRIVGVFDANNARITTLGDPMLKILSPDIDARKTTINEFRELFDGNAAEFKSRVYEIAELLDPYERLEQAHRLQKESSELFYEILDQRLRRRKLRTDQLMPEVAHLILNGLRLPASLEGDFSHASEESARNLINDVGVERTAQRWSCLPVRTPTILINALKSVPIEERNGIVNRLSKRSASPVTKLHVANLTLRAECDVAEARKALQSLYNGTTGEADFAAFQAVLTFVNGEIDTCLDSKTIAPQMKLAVVWAHASRLHNIFHAAGVSAKDISEMFQQYTRQLNAETMIREPDLWDDCLHPHGLNRTLFLTHGIAKMFTGIESTKLADVGIDPMFEEVFLIDVNGTKIPQLPLLHDSSLESDGLSSILGGDHAEALRLMVDDSGLEIVSSNKLHEIVDQALDQLINDKNHSAWASIITVLGDLPIYSDLREKFRQALGTIEINADFMAEPGLAKIALTTSANQVRHWGDEEMRESLKARILEAIKFEVEATQREAPTEEDSSRHRIEGFVDAALKLSIVRGDLNATGQQLADVLGKISELWPDFPERLGPLVTSFLWELPVEVVQSWWPLCLKLRATLREGL
jgi:hypothetical protein